MKFSDNLTSLTTSSHPRYSADLNLFSNRSITRKEKDAENRIRLSMVEYIGGNKKINIERVKTRHKGIVGEVYLTISQ